MLQEANRHLQHIQFSEGPLLTAATITELSVALQMPQED